MGEYLRFGTEIRCFNPDDTETEMYISSDWTDVSLSQILEEAQEKWPGCNLSQLSIRAEHMQTTCLGYDRYDPTDYTNFLRITYKKV